MNIDWLSLENVLRGFLENDLGRAAVGDEY